MMNNNNNQINSVDRKTNPPSSAPEIQAPGQTTASGVTSATSSPRSGRGRKRNSSEQILQTRYRGKAHDFYRRQQWDKWYEEFSQATNPDGSLKFPTALSFAKSKGKTTKEIQWILAAIGPKPLLPAKRKNPTIPWLGDWLERRRQGFWFGTEKAVALTTVIEERRGAFEAARAAGQLNAEWSTRFAGLANQFDNFFLPQMFEPSLPYKQKIKVMKDYLKFQGKTFEMFHTANVDYLQCNGIYRDRISILAEIASASAVARAAINEEKTIEQVEAEFKQAGTRLKEMKLMRRLEQSMEQSTGAALSSDAKAKEVRKMFAEMMCEKNERFGIELPGGDIELPIIEGMDGDESPNGGK